MASISFQGRLTNVLAISFLCYNKVGLEQVSSGGEKTGQAWHLNELVPVSSERLKRTLTGNLESLSLAADGRQQQACCLQRMLNRFMLRLGNR
jgi:hypothetical protein